MADETTPAPLSDAEIAGIGEYVDGFTSEQVGGWLDGIHVDEATVFADFMRHDIPRLIATLAAYREIVAAVAAANPYGSWYPATNGPAGVVCRWCMERAVSPQQCQHDAECTWKRARALLAQQKG